MPQTSDMENVTMYLNRFSTKQAALGWSLFWKVKRVHGRDRNSHIQASKTPKKSSCPIRRSVGVPNECRFLTYQSYEKKHQKLIFPNFSLKIWHTTIYFAEVDCTRQTTSVDTSHDEVSIIAKKVQNYSILTRLSTASSISSLYLCGWHVVRHENGRVLTSAIHFWDACPNFVGEKLEFSVFYVFFA